MILISFLTCVMVNWSIYFEKLTSGWIFFFLFLLETLCSSQFCEFELNLDIIFYISSCIVSFNMFMHHIVLLVLFFWLTCSLPLVCFCCFSHFFVLLFLILAPCLGRLELIGFPLPLLCLLLGFSCLGMSVRVRPMRNLIVYVRFGLSVLWF